MNIRDGKKIKCSKNKLPFRQCRKYQSPVSTHGLILNILDNFEIYGSFRLRLMWTFSLIENIVKQKPKKIADFIKDFVDFQNWMKIQFCWRQILHICWIWSVYNLDYYTKFYIYKFWYHFDTVLYQFLETGASGRILIGLDQLLKFLSFITLSFFLYSPFKWFPCPKLT